MKTAYLALGSNLGDRLEFLRFAARKLVQNGVEVAAKSKIYASQSVESGGEGDFLNAVLRVRTSLNAPQLLALCQSIEIEAGREPASAGLHRFGARALDIDILWFDGEVWNETELEIPHPRALNRNFVLKPLLDVLEGGWLEATDLSWSRSLATDERR
jgi:2-amino-4-hydroxy-6-hydroxymethyldihydropteridine diphosphokinase